MRLKYEPSSEPLHISVERRHTTGDDCQVGSLEWGGSTKIVTLASHRERKKEEERGPTTVGDSASLLLLLYYFQA